MTVLIECRKLVLRINGHCLINKLNLSIKSGQSWGILGPNGSGKTTLLKTLCALHLPDNGEIRVAGKEISNYRRRLLARWIGLLPQETSWSFPMSVKDIVQMGRYSYQSFFNPASKKDLKIALEAMQLLKIDSLADRSVETLSGGEARRVAMAILVCQSPLLALLDEPENHLDPGIRFKLLKLISDYFRINGMATIMTLHDPNIALRFCSHLLLIQGDGNYYISSTKDIMSGEIFSKLYSHEMLEYNRKGETIYYPA